MNWHRINLALIAVLSIIDLVIGIELYKEKKSTDYLPQDMIEEAEKSLSEMGVDINDAADTRILTKQIYVYETENAYAEAMRENAVRTHPSLLSAISVLIDKPLSYVEQNINYFDLPDGLSLSMGSDDDSLAAAAVYGKCTFEFFGAEFEKSPFDGISSAELREFDSSYVKKAIGNFFESVYDGAVGFRILGECERDDCVVSACVLTLDGLDISDTRLYFAFREQKPVAVYGDLFFSPPVPTYDAELSDGINILYFLSSIVDTNVTLQSEKLIYIFSEYDDLKYYLIPTWELVYQTDTGAVVTKRLNALTGTLTE